MVIQPHGSKATKEKKEWGKITNATLSESDNGYGYYLKTIVILEDQTQWFYL